MLRTFGLLLSVIVLAFGVVACGGDDEEEPASGGTTTTETETTETTEDTGTTEDAETDTPGGGATDEQIAAAVEQCKSAIQAQPQLSDGLKGELEELCDKAASGDVEDARQASIDVCIKVAEELVPDESQREQVVASCEASAPAP